jgi:hypothetical protein
LTLKRNPLAGNPSGAFGIGLVAGNGAKVSILGSAMDGRREKGRGAMVAKFAQVSDVSAVEFRR